MKPIRLVLFLCLVLLLAACGEQTAPAPTPDAIPAAAAESFVPEPKLAFRGDDWALRASLEVLAYSSERPGQLKVDYRVTNHLDLAITRLRFHLGCLDRDGNALNDESTTVTVSLEEQPLAAGETREFTRTHYFTGAEKTALLHIVPLEASTEEELAPWAEPQPDNLLLDFCNDPLLRERLTDLDTAPPTALLYQDDLGNRVLIDDPAVIRTVAETLRQVRIGQASSRNVDDGGYTYTFVTDDGSTWDLRFDYRTLFFWHNQNYEVLDDGGLFTLNLIA